MILVRCNGKELTVYNITPAIFHLTAGTVPLKPCGWFLMEESEARALLRELLNTGVYEGGKLV